MVVVIGGAVVAALLATLISRPECGTCGQHGQSDGEWAIGRGRAQERQG